jgi:hypothetical protein
MKMKSEGSVRTSPSPLLLIVLVLGLVGCNTTYPSLRQAKTACREWESDEKTVTWTVNPRWSNPNRERTSRRCEEESETNQVLGLINQVIEDGDFVGKENEGKFKVVKNFRY